MRRRSGDAGRGRPHDCRCPESSDASGPFPRSDHCPFASRAAAPRTGVPVVTAEARSAPSLLRRLLLRRRAASVGRLLRRRRASDSHAAATVAAAPAVAVAPATWRLHRGASTPVPPGDAVAGRQRRDRWLLSRATATSRSALTCASTGSFAPTLQTTPPARLPVSWRSGHLAGDDSSAIGPRPERHS